MALRTVIFLLGRFFHARYEVGTSLWRLSYICDTAAGPFAVASFRQP